MGKNKIELDKYEKLNAKNEEMGCEIIRREMESSEHINLSGNILILSDRLNKLAVSLGTYIERITDADVVGVMSNYDEVMECESLEIDYLIIVGYLENKMTYQVVNDLRKIHKNINIVKWASLDGLIFEYCNKYNITHQFHRWGKLEAFMYYLYFMKKSLF